MKKFVRLDGAALQRANLNEDLDSTLVLLRHQLKKGVTVVEYALMLALVAIAVALATPNIASAVISVFSKASSVMAK